MLVADRTESVPTIALGRCCSAFSVARSLVYHRRPRDVDLAVAVYKAGTPFGVRTPMLEGRGRVNGAMLLAGLIDEISVLIVPGADSAPASRPYSISTMVRRPGARLRRESIERRGGDLSWARYRVDGPSSESNSRIAAV